MNAKYFGIFLADPFIPIYDQYVEVLKESSEFSTPLGLKYQGLSVDELKSCSLENQDQWSIDEYLFRTEPSVRITSNFFCRKYPYLIVNELYAHLQNSALTTFNKYTAERGEFIHFFRKMMKTSSLFYRKTEGKLYEQRLKTLGMRLSDVSDDALYHIENLTYDCQYEKNILLKIDLENYIASLPKKTQKIITMYLSSYTLREIANSSNTPLSSVAFCVKKTFKNFTQKYL